MLILILKRTIPNVNVNVNTSKQYQNQDGTVLIKDYFADNNSTDGAKICVDIDAEKPLPLSRQGTSQQTG
ncbi:hypothetical protein BSPWISOXPB_227 [uncultured Gammaproteobacteria bacterium]|nr:hypothetical protein BSPWISOXPB_227 [uncultured Gammaproteobacteria bacterium]